MAASKPTFQVLIGMAGFEPTTSSSQMKRATKLHHIPFLILKTKSSHEDKIQSGVEPEGF